MFQSVPILTHDLLLSTILEHCGTSLACNRLAEKGSPSLDRLATAADAWPLQAIPSLSFRGQSAPAYAGGSAPALNAIPTGLLSLWVDCCRSNSGKWLFEMPARLERIEPTVPTSNRHARTLARCPAGSSQDATQRSRSAPNPRVGRPGNRSPSKSTRPRYAPGRTRAGATLAHTRQLRLRPPREQVVKAVRGLAPATDDDFAEPARRRR
jgi:hypothetical protein